MDAETARAVVERLRDHLALVDQNILGREMVVLTVDDARALLTALQAAVAGERERIAALPIHMFACLCSEPCFFRRSDSRKKPENVKVLAAAIRREGA